MKKLLLCIGLISLINVALCQSDNNINNINDMILNSIKMYNVKFGPSFYCKEDLPNDFPYENIDSCHFVLLQEIRNLPMQERKALRNGVYLERVQYRLEGNRFFVKITRYKCKWLHRMRLTFSMSLCFSSNFVYEYSCREQNWCLLNNDSM